MEYDSTRKAKTYPFLVDKIGATGPLKFPSVDAILARSDIDPGVYRNVG